ncbi:MAG: hypothetical protein LBJ36_04785 [Synergistaceae bacterium]|jgi:hypothetical protein|nr:hypothetical protein [Synergistaceae bacterium]
MAQKRENILILAKTYPTPSAKNVETTCIAGINEDGEMRRLFPVPFRLLTKESQFHKWQWINVAIEKSSTDKRIESYKISFEDIRPGVILNTKQDWEKRIAWINRVPVVTKFLPDRSSPHLQKDQSLVLYKLQEPVRLEIVSSSTEWTTEELRKLKQDGSLFSREEALLPPALEKIPFDFYYRFKANTADGTGHEIRIKITDWEAGALYRNCFRFYREQWQSQFQQRLERDE